MAGVGDPGYKAPVASLALLPDTIRERQANGQSATGKIDQLELTGVTIELIEPGPCVGQANAFSMSRAVF